MCRNIEPAWRKCRSANAATKGFYLTGFRGIGKSIHICMYGLLNSVFASATTVSTGSADDVVDDGIPNLRVLPFTPESDENPGLDDGILKLTPYVKSGKVTEARNLSMVDPVLFAGVKSHSGFFNVNETLKWNLFFWFFPVANKTLSSTPWVIWLQGGPGASSLWGLFNELGPLTVVNETAQKMPITWASDYSLLFIDNPVGVGYSYSESGKYAESQDDIGRSLLNFIQQFLQVFPELRSAPLFLAGEGYGGKYVISFGHYIHNNKNLSMPINLKGIAIGSGWIDPPSLLYNAELGLQHGLLDFDGAQLVEEADSLARKYWEVGDMVNYNKMYGQGAHIMQKLSNAVLFNYVVGIGEETSNYGTLLCQQDIKNAIHVGRLHYESHYSNVLHALKHEIHLSVKPWLEELLEHYGVLSYSGQLDLYVSYSKLVHMYQNLTWSKAADYRNANRTFVTEVKTEEEDKDKLMEKAVVLFVKEGGNLVDVMVRKAGHLTPYDQPVYCKLMINTFINTYCNCTWVCNAQVTSDHCKA